MKKIIPFAGIVILILLAGCTAEAPLQSHQKVGCCNPLEIDDEDGPCVLGSDVNENTSVTDTHYCDLDLLTCNVTLEIRHSPTQIEEREYIVLPACTELEVPLQCIQPECVAQVCGSFSYRPQQVISYQDTAELRRELEDREREDVPLEDDPEVKNLYGATCLMLDMDENLSKVFSNTKESFVNTFRFGVGESFQDFERYRQLFPFSDRHCNVNPNEDAKDRFANYFKDPDEDASEIFRERLDDLLYCPTDFDSPFRNDVYGDTDQPPNYKFERVERTGDGELRLESQDFDRDFYDHILRWLYREELSEAALGAEDPVPAVFECQNPTQCKSQNCDINEYKRGMCQKNDGTWVNCQCYNDGRACAGETVFQVDLQSGGSPVDTLDDAIDLYESGGDLYISIPRRTELYYHSYNPDCNGVGESVDDEVYYCQTEEGDDAGCYYYNEPPSGQESGDIGWDSPTEFASYRMNCTSVSATTKNCYLMDNPATTFRMYDAGGNKLKPNQHGAATFTVDCPSGTSGTFFCDRYRNVRNTNNDDRKRWMSDIEDMDDVLYLFPNDIYFFAEDKPVPEPEGDHSQWYRAMGVGRTYIGYTLLPPEEFEKTNFYQACELDDNDYDYITVNPKFRWSGGQQDSGRVWLENNRGYQGYRYTKHLDNPITYIDARGFRQRKRAQCHWDGDDWGKYWYTRYIVLIKNSGACSRTPDERLVNRVFGWCEGCSYLTLAQHEIKTSEPYEELVEEKYRGEGEPYETRSICFSIVSGSPICAIEHPEGNYEGKVFNSPLDQDPESIFLLEKQIKYLKEGVLPVLDVTDESNWNVIENEVIVEVREGTWELIDKVEASIYYAQQTKEDTENMPSPGIEIDSPGDEGGEGGTSGTLDAQAIIDSMDIIIDELWDVHSKLVDADNHMEEALDTGDDQLRRSELGLALGEMYGATENIEIAKDEAYFGCSLLGADEIMDQILDAQSGGRELDDNLPDLCKRMFGATEEFFFMGTVTTTPLDEDLQDIYEKLSEELQKLHDGIWPEGPNIVIVHTVTSDNVGEELANEIKLRASIVKTICGKCLVAVEVNNGPAGTMDGETRRLLDLLTLLALDTVGEEEMWDILDGVAIGFYPHEYAQDEPALCEHGAAGLYSKLIEELQLYGNEVRTRHNKFVLVNKMFIDRDVEPDCWETTEEEVTEDPMFKVLSRFAFRQRTLTQAGVIGIIYSDTDQLEESSGGGTRYSEQFCSLEKAARLFVSDPPITIYKRTPLKDDVECQKCSNEAISLGRCTAVCDNGIECNMPSPGDMVAPAHHYGCPTDSYPNSPSTKCSDIPSGNIMTCTLIHSDGDVEILSVDASDLDETFPDVIAGMPKGLRCTLEDESGAYTFSKIDLQGKANAPVVYSYSDNPQEDCGFPDPNVETPQQCGGFELPIKNYDIECKYDAVPPSWPP